MSEPTPQPAPAEFDKELFLLQRIANQAAQMAQLEMRVAELEHNLKGQQS